MDLIGDVIGNIIGTNNEDKGDKTKTFKRSPRNEVNVYNSQNTRKMRNEVRRRTRKMANKYEDSGSMSDSDSAYSDDNSNNGDKDSMYTIESMRGNTNVDYNNPTFFMDNQSKMIDNRKYERRTVRKVKSKKGFLSQFDPLELDTFGDPSSYNAVHNSVGTNASIKRLETERALAYDGGYSNFEKDCDGTYGVVHPKDFKMKLVPFFRSRGGNQDYNRSDLHQRKMEAFTGSAKNPAWKSKKESGPLFSPIVGATNIYGNSVPTDEFEGRYIPSRERKNELPFTQVQQGPGLGLGSNEASSHGFHDNYRVAPISTDVLRGPRGPKVSYTPPVIMGKKGTKGRVHGRQENRKPPTFADWGTERITGVTGHGHIRAPTMRRVYNPDNMATRNRGVEDQQRYGPAGASDTHSIVPDNMRGNFRRASKENYLQAEPRQITLVEGMQARPSSTPYVPDPTRRAQHNFTYLGPAGRDGVGQGHSFNMVTNIPDPTKRDQHNTTGRQGTAVSARERHYINNYEAPDPTKRDQHNSTGRSGKGIGVTREHYTNTYDAPDPTKRDQHNSTGRSGTGMKVRREHYTNNYDTPDPTKRDQHNSTGRAGTGVRVRREHYTNNYDAPDPTKRDQHNTTGRSGVGFRVRKELYANNYEAPDPTKRDQHNSTGRAGVGFRVRKELYTNNYDTPDPTKRDQHQYSRSRGGVSGRESSYVNNEDAPDPTKRDMYKFKRTKGGVSGKESAYVNTYDAPDPTKRDMYKSKRSKGGAASVNSKTYAFNYVDNIPAPTMRDIHGKNKYVNPAKNAIEGQRSRRDANTMSQNVSREQTLKGRAPTNSNYDKGPTFQFTKVELKDPVQMYEGRMPIKSTTYTTDRFMPGSAFNRNESYYEDNRKQYVKDTLNGNPYVNNLLHKAVNNY